MSQSKSVHKQLLGRVARRLKSFGLSEEGAAIVVAVSGGPDSVAMLRLLYELREPLALRLFVAHLNHGLRGQESDGDQQFVEDLARNFDLPLDIKEIGLKQFYENEGGNLQALARRHRYDFLLEVARRRGARWLATGHTMDDQAETILMGLVRGAGSRGLSGIPASRIQDDITLVRPIIDIGRSEILSCLEYRSMTYRNDSSNKKTNYSRNRLRIEVLPTLRQINPRVSHSMAHTGKVLADEDALLRALTEKTLEEVTAQAPEIRSVHGEKILWCALHSKIAEQPVALVRRIAMGRLEEFLGDGYIPLAEQIEAIVEAIKSPAPQWDLCLAGDVKFCRRYDSVYMVKVTGEVEEQQPQFIVLPDSGEVEVASLGGVLKVERMPRPEDFEELIRDKKVKEGCTCYLDAQKVQGELVLRPRQPGDRMPVLGLSGSKKIKDIMIEAKVSREERGKPLLLTCGTDILWVIGCTMNDNYKVQPESDDVIRVEIERIL